MTSPCHLLAGCLVLACAFPAPAVALQSPAGPTQREAAGLQAGAEAPRHGFSFGLSLGHDQARDDLLVPMRWAGPGLGLRFGWDRAGAATRHEAALQLPVSLFLNRYDHKAIALGLEASYALVRAVRPTGNRGTLELGGHARIDLHDGYYGSWDEEHAYWFTAWAVGPRLGWTDAPGRTWQLGALLEVPVVALVSRPPRYRLNKADPLTHLSFHLFDTSRNLRFAAPPDYLALHAGIRLTKPRTSGLALGWDFDLATYADPARVITLSQRIHVSRRVAW